MLFDRYQNKIEIPEHKRENKYSNLEFFLKIQNILHKQNDLK